MMALLELYTHFSIHIRDRAECNAVEGAAGGAGTSTTEIYLQHRKTVNA